MNILKFISMGGTHVDGLPILQTWFELPALDRLDSLFIQTEPERTDNTDISRQALFIDGQRKE